MSIVQAAMTDADTKERKALREVFHDIVLLICLWHMSRAVSSRLQVDTGKNTSGTAEVKARRDQVRSELRRFVQRVVFG